MGPLLQLQTIGCDNWGLPNDFRRWLSFDVSRGGSYPTKNYEKFLGLPVRVENHRDPRPTNPTNIIVHRGTYPTKPLWKFIS